MIKQFILALALAAGTAAAADPYQRHPYVQFQPPEWTRNPANSQINTRQSTPKATPYKCGGKVK